MLSGRDMEADDPWEQMAHFPTSPDWPRGLSLAPCATLDRVIQLETPNSSSYALPIYGMRHFLELRPLSLEGVWG